MVSNICGTIIYLLSIYLHAHPLLIHLSLTIIDDLSDGIDHLRHELGRLGLHSGRQAAKGFHVRVEFINKPTAQRERVLTGRGLTRASKGKGKEKEKVNLYFVKF